MIYGLIFEMVKPPSSQESTKKHREYKTEDIQSAKNTDFHTEDNSLKIWMTKFLTNGYFVVHVVRLIVLREEIQHQLGYIKHSKTL